MNEELGGIDVQQLLKSLGQTLELMPEDLGRAQLALLTVNLVVLSTISYQLFDVMRALQPDLSEEDLTKRYVDAQVMLTTRIWSEILEKMGK